MSETIFDAEMTTTREGSSKPVSLSGSRNITPPWSPTMSQALPAFSATLAWLDGRMFGVYSRISNGRLHSAMGSPPWCPWKETVLAGPYNYLQQIPGKDVRAQVIIAFNEWLDVPLDHLEIVIECIRMLHTASLLVDDIEDNSALRRGIPVAHSIYGIAQTINSANYFYFCAMKELQGLQCAEALAHFVDELVQLHRGQGLDLYWRDSLTCPTEEEYLDMVGNKTGGLFRLCIKLMETQARRPAPPECVPLANLLGLLFQIRDDYQNLCSNEYTKSKGYCDDLTEGKFSFPVIHSILRDQSNTELLNILKQKSMDPEIKQYAVQYMERMGSFAYTREALKTLMAKAREIVDYISAGNESGKPMHAILDKLAITDK